MTWRALPLLLCAAPALAGGWGEPHLDSLPRTEAERARIAAVLTPPADPGAAQRFEERPAGAGTVFGTPRSGPFLAPSANLPDEEEMDFVVGGSFFRRLWVTAPASTEASDGLGPLYNARACLRCHPGGGRGHPPEPGASDSGVSFFLRLSIPEDQSTLAAETLAHLGAAPEPVYGLQFQDKSIAGVPAEGQVALSYEERIEVLDDGTEVALRVPRYDLTSLGYGPLHPEVRVSPRVAPQMIGLGLLEAIPEADILAGADPDDTDGNGISGRANRVWSRGYGQWMLGRFGLKAGAPTVWEQSADAFAGDIGLGTPLHPEGWGECTNAQTACRAAPTGNTARYANLEVPEEVLDLVTHYARNLAVPARRRSNAPEVLRGKALFHGAGCAACHRPAFVTHRLADRPAQSFQLIWPYTDLLLHDMGPGLADGRSEFAATGREWRTAPLWGIGWTQEVSGHTFFLHDGRARSLTEAILWHGGEASAAQRAFKSMTAADRADLIAFLESL